MPKSIASHNSISKRSVIQWFLAGLVTLAIIFFVALIPLFFYCKNIFSNMEIQKNSQHIGFGVSQLESTVHTVNSASYSLRADTRFLPFLYLNPDASDVSIQTGITMQNYMSSLLLPSTLITDWGITFSDKMAVTSRRFVSATDAFTYYHESFQVDNLTYDEWKALLQEFSGRFMPVHHVSNISGNYDALIYSIPWGKNTYLYACLNVSDVKKSLVGVDQLDNFYITLEDNDGFCLYSDLPKEFSEFHSVRQKCAVGNLTISVHIPNALLNKQMTPLYSFLGLYLIICIMVVISCAFISSRLSAKPVIKIIDSYQTDLQECQLTITTQEKVIQARYMEKALHGSLVTDAEYDLFFSYFPKFPSGFNMILVGLIETPTKNGTIYPNSLSLVQHYLEQHSLYAYMQQLTKTTLLIIIENNLFDEYVNLLNHLIENINHEEPCYHAWGIASKSYNHPKSLPFAYRQIQDLHSQISLENLTQLCIASDYNVAEKAKFQMSDTLSIYSAIVNGNDEVALLKLDYYSNQLCNQNYSIFEMFRSVLLCIKQEYSQLLIDVEVPFYNTQTDLYSLLSESIQRICDIFRAFKSNSESDSFAQQIKAYLDLHYAEESLCNTMLEDHFGCSYAKIRKAFSQEIGTPISAYIEGKRMELANELLFRGKDTITDVATKCGYTNYNTFHKAYRRVFGHAPTDIKPQNQ